MRNELEVRHAPEDIDAELDEAMTTIASPDPVQARDSATQQR